MARHLPIVLFALATLLFALSMQSASAQTITTSFSNGVPLPQGASARVNVSGLTSVSQGSSTGSNCPATGNDCVCPANGYCFLIMPPNDIVPTNGIENCPYNAGPATVPSEPICTASSGFPCWASDVVLSSCNGGTCEYVYTSSFMPDNAATYQFCVYADDDVGNPYTFVPSSQTGQTGYSEYPFSINGITAPIAQSHGDVQINSVPSSFPLGAAAPIGLFSTLPPGSTATTYPDICQNGTCYIELANSMTGCVDPQTTLSDCSILATPPATACILNTGYYLPYWGNNGKPASYNQTLNTAYLPNGNYLVCGYDYEPLTGTSELFAYNYSSMEITCVKGQCTSNGAPSNPPIGPGYGTGQFTVGPPCPTCGLTVVPGSTGATPLALTTYQNILCGLAGFISLVSIVLSLVLLLLGAALYMGAAALPGQTAGVARGYGQNLLIAGVATAIITGVAFWLITTWLPNVSPYTGASGLTFLLPIANGGCIGAI